MPTMNLATVNRRQVTKNDFRGLGRCSSHLYYLGVFASWSVRLLSGDPGGESFLLLRMAGVVVEGRRLFVKAGNCLTSNSDQNVKKN